MSRVSEIEHNAVFAAVGSAALVHAPVGLTAITSLVSGAMMIELRARTLASREGAGAKATGGSTGVIVVGCLPRTLANAGALWSAARLTAGVVSLTEVHGIFVDPAIPREAMEVVLRCARARAPRHPAAENTRQGGCVRTDMLLMRHCAAERARCPAGRTAQLAQAGACVVRKATVMHGVRVHGVPVIVHARPAAMGHRAHGSAGILSAIVPDGFGVP
jgi:hypothetical protein